MRKLFVVAVLAFGLWGWRGGGESVEVAPSPCYSVDNRIDGSHASKCTSATPTLLICVAPPLRLET